MAKKKEKKKKIRVVLDPAKPNKRLAREARKFFKSLKKKK